jgi:cell wall-associated NlpC family hydrolase
LRSSNCQPSPDTKITKRFKRFAGILPALILGMLFPFQTVDTTAAAPRDKAQAVAAPAQANAPKRAKSPSKSKKASATKPKKASRSKKTSKPKPLVNTTTKAKAETITSQVSDELPERLESEIKQYFGLRYRMGGTGQNGIDCSALVQKVYADVFDIDLPRNSFEQSRLDKMENVPGDEIETGDLLFFGPRRKHVNHVGIYLAGGYFLHAARTEGVTISHLDDTYWKSRWMLTKRFRGLEIGYDEAPDSDIDWAFTELAIGSALSGDTEGISYLEGGLKFNDWPEFRLTGFYSRAMAESIEASGSGQSLALQPLPYYLDEGVSGFRLAAVFAPLPWEGFRLIPSVTQISTRNRTAGLDEDNQTLGLESWVSLPSSRMAIFMGANAQNREDILSRPLDLAPDWRTLDFSFGLHYHLSETLNISLTGTHAYRASFEEDEAQDGLDRLLEDIAFRMSFKF